MSMISDVYKEIKCQCLDRLCSMYLPSRVQSQSQRSFNPENDSFSSIQSGQLTDLLLQFRPLMFATPVLMIIALSPASVEVSIHFLGKDSLGLTNIRQNPFPLTSQDSKQLKYAISPVIAG